MREKRIPSQAENENREAAAFVGLVIQYCRRRHPLPRDLIRQLTRIGAFFLRGHADLAVDYEGLRRELNDLADEYTYEIATALGRAQNIEWRKRAKR